MTKSKIVMIATLLSIAVFSFIYYLTIQSNQQKEVENIKQKLIESVKNDPLMNYGKDRDGNEYNPIALMFEHGSSAQEIFNKGTTKENIKIMIITQSSTPYAKAGAIQYDFNNNTNQISRTVSFSILEPDYKQAVKIIKKWDDLRQVKEQKNIDYGSYNEETREDIVLKLEKEKKYKEDYIKYCGVVDSGWFYVWSQSYYKKFSKAVTLDDLANCLKARGYGDETINSLAQDENGNKKTYKEFFESTPPYQGGNQ